MSFGATRESLTQLPPRLREASYALGKTRATTIRRVLLPSRSVRLGMASGTVLGMGRIIGDTAILTILLGSTLRNEPIGHTPLFSTLRGTGSTLTSYVYNNSPAGEGGAPDKAYAAAFVLLMIVLALNALVTRLSRRASPWAPFNGRRKIEPRRDLHEDERAMAELAGTGSSPPPPVRRIVVDREPHVAPARPAPNGNGAAGATIAAPRSRTRETARDERARADARSNRCGWHTARTGSCET